MLTCWRVLPLLKTAMVAPIASTVGGLPSELRVGTDDGLGWPVGDQARSRAARGPASIA